MATIGLDEVMEYKSGETFVAFDHCSGGELNYPEGESPEHYDGIGGQSAHNYGMLTFGGNAETYLQDGALLTTNLLRSFINYLPTAITEIQAGPISVTDGARKQSTCYIDSVSVECEVGGLVTVKYDWVALEETAVTISTTAAKSATARYSWENADVLFDGANYQCERWSIEFNNNLKGITSLDAGTVGKLRWVEEYLPGIPNCTVSADFKADPGVNLRADAPAAFDIVATATNGTSTFTASSASGNGFLPSAVPLQLVSGDEEVVYSISGELAHDDACMLVAGNLFAIA